MFRGEDNAEAMATKAATWFADFSSFKSLLTNSNTRGASSRSPERP